MDLRDLAYFEVIADTQNLGRAAEILGRTKPALTKSIRRLEDSLGASLFMRVGRGIALTPVGQVLRDRAKRIGNAVDDVQREVSDFAKGRAGHVRIGSGATTVELLLPHMFSRVSRNLPNVTSELVIGMNDVLRGSLAAGKLDLVLGPVMRDEGLTFATEVLADDTVVVAARAGHPLSQRQNLTIEDLCEHKWILPAASVASRQWLDQAFISRNLPPPKVHIETSTVHLSPQLIAQTDLLSFIPRLNLQPNRARADLVELAIEATTLSRHFGIIHRHDSYLSPAAQTIISEIRASAKALFHRP